MGGDPRLSGPDLSLGIDKNEVADGAMLLGHAGGESVLLARSGSDVLAIGATCTHYGGPLAEGLRVGDTVHCPWHHACFSLRTGEASAPARDPVACFGVEERDGKLYVLGKRAAARAPAQASSLPGPGSIVIVGAGAAGNAAAEMLRREGHAGAITLIGEEESLPVDRPNLSKDYLAGSAPEEWIPLRSTDFYAEKTIDVRLGTRVQSIDVHGKSLTLGDGTTLAYGALLLATGAPPNRPTLPGGDLPHVHCLRTLADSRALIARIAGARQAIIVGAGFIGLEVAASLRARGLEVAIVAPDALPLARILGDALGAAIKKLHEEHGVMFHLGARPASVDENSVTLENGTKLPADLVVFGIGVHPATELAEAAGLAVDRGVVVDEYLRTSAPGVFAAGDVARWLDARTGEKVRVEHWVVATRQGEIAALNMLGRQRRYDAVPFFWSAHYDVTLAYVGHAERWDRIDVNGSIDERDCAVAFRRGDRTLAVATMGRDRSSLEAEVALGAGDEATLRRIVP
jgi:NADPH-dependent 2,4-dienoyl-CoA reductase/sulfur reductase-like enzyme/nitrite reductase/ring-hydroxylating ferredoxin subunit